MSDWGGGVALMDGEQDGQVSGLSEWSAVLSHCIKRARRWREPPGWSAGDWLEEVRAEAAAAAWQASRIFDPDRGVPRYAFLRRRVLHRLLEWYRKEWNFALRHSAGAGWRAAEA